MLTELPVADPRSMRLATAGPVIASCFLRPPRSSLIAEIGAAQARLLQAHPSIFSLAIIPRMPTAGRAQDTQAVLPTPQERTSSVKSAAAVADAFAGKVAASAVVVQSGGLIAVFVRSFVAAYALLSRPSGPTATFRSIEEAIRWARSQPGVPPLPGGLEGALERWVAGIASEGAGP